jgi:26S proteasome regulatory subunit N9
VEVSNIQRELGQAEEARKNLDECERILEKFDAVETIVHAAFYKANAEYYKVNRFLTPGRVKLTEK